MYKEIKEIDNSFITYLGIYEALDEVLKRMKESKALGDFERYCILFEKLYILTKENKYEHRYL